MTAAQKPTARHIIRDALNLPRPGGVREVGVRVNAVETGLALEDLRVVVCSLSSAGIEEERRIVAVTNNERRNSCKERI